MVVNPLKLGKGFESILAHVHKRPSLPPKYVKKIQQIAHRGKGRIDLSIIEFQNAHMYDLVSELDRLLESFFCRTRNDWRLAIDPRRELGPREDFQHSLQGWGLQFFQYANPPLERMRQQIA